MKFNQANETMEITVKRCRQSTSFYVEGRSVLHAKEGLVVKAKIFIVSGTLATLLYITLSWSFIEAQIYPNSDIIKESPSILATTAKQSTLDILNEQGVFFGRAYSSNGHLITARHVIDAICHGFPCKDKFIKVSGFLDNKSFSKLIMLGDNMMCREWLDICLVVTEEEVFQKMLVERSPSTKVQTSMSDIFVKNLNGDQLKRGQIEKNHILGPEIKMKLKMGYSGSPVFNSDGSPAAILSQAGESSLSLLPIFLVSTPLGFDKKLIFTVSNTIGFDAIDLVYDCYEKRSCSFDEEANFFVEKFSKISLKNFSLIDRALLQFTNQLFWNAWGADLTQPNRNPYLDFEAFKSEFQRIAQRSGKKMDDSNLDKIWLLYALSILDEDSADETMKTSTLAELTKVRTSIEESGLAQNVDFILKKYK